MFYRKSDTISTMQMGMSQVDLVLSEVLYEEGLCDPPWR